MYSRYFLPLIQLALLPSLLLGVNGIYFNRRRKIFYTTKFSRFRVILSTITILFFATFFCGRTLEIFLYKGGSKNEYFHVSFAFSFIFTTCSGLLFFTIVFQTRIAQVMTQVVRYCINFEPPLKKRISGKVQFSLALFSKGRKTRRVRDALPSIFFFTGTIQRKYQCHVIPNIWFDFVTCTLLAKKSKETELNGIPIPLSCPAPETFFQVVYVAPKRFHGKWMVNYDPSKSMPGIILDVIIALNCMCFSTIPWFTRLHYLIYPKTPIFLTTLLPPRLQNDPRIYWGYALVPTYYAFAVWQNIWPLALLALVYIFSSIPLLFFEFCVGANHQKTKESLRSAWNLPIEYRCVELMHRKLVLIAGYVIMAGHVVVSEFILFANATVILDKGGMGMRVKILLLLWSAVGQTIWIFGLEICGRFHEQAKKTLKSWKNMKFRTKEQKLYMNRFRRSCRPLKIGKEGLFIITILTVLKFMKAIIKGTFRAVLTIGRV
ncbi:hypothetical protein Fcan01_25046 [Folsomia candida]|uniref:Uncharacterized protein n=1 Tax=Folsomia candida TaxID=158441 RepID=A0A226D5K9_FOLCA|nr:hypothetical protein Fcan01_25046 [Folsomia candida]